MRREGQEQVIRSLRNVLISPDREARGSDNRRRGCLHSGVLWKVRSGRDNRLLTQHLAPARITRMSRSQISASRRKTTYVNASCVFMCRPIIVSPSRGCNFLSDGFRIPPMGQTVSRKVEVLSLLTHAHGSVAYAQCAAGCRQGQDGDAARDAARDTNGCRHCAGALRSRSVGSNEVKLTCDQCAAGS